MQYRPEIDGLRAIAVMAVLLFHADLISGGFIGVDIFFVISGYLITGIILKNLNFQRFSFASFYEKRARRILPALFLVTLAAVPFALYYLQPWKRIEFGKSIIAIVFFCANVLYFYSVSYFNNPEEYNPLLHTWSLGVEEQYYLLYPIFLFVIVKYLKKYLTLIISLFFFSSLIYSQYLSSADAAASFFLLPSRIWELMLGGLLAHHETARKHQMQATKIWLPAVGLMWVVIAFLWFDEYFITPGFITLIPLLGTACIIWYCDNNNPITKILSHRSLVFIGKISYSIYLWHFPIFVFWDISHPRSDHILTKIILIIMTVIIAKLSWKYVEVPCRNMQRVKLKIFSIVMLIVASSIIAIGYIIIEYDGFPNYNRPKITSSLRRDPEIGLCNFTDNPTIQQWYCKLGSVGSDTATFAMLGDSHAKDSLSALNFAANEVKVWGIASTDAGCPALLDFSIRGKSHMRCKNLNQKMYEEVKKNNIKNIILISKWNHSIYKNSKNIDEVNAALKHTVNEYSKIGTNVYLVLQTPTQVALPYYLYNAISQKSPQQQEESLQKLSITREEFQQQAKQFKQLVNAIHEPKFHIVDFSDVFCNAVICPIGTSQESIYADHNHLSASGVRKLRAYYISLLQKMQTQRDADSK